MTSDRPKSKSTNSTLEVRKATIEDMEAVLAFYKQMIDEMQGTDFDVLWKYDEHPTNASLREATEQGQMYIGIAEDGNIACAMVVNHDQAPGYEEVPWKIQAPVSNVGVIHSVATLPAYHGRGFATALMKGVIEMTRNEGLRSLRLDTFVDNDRSQGLYTKLGFDSLGNWPLYYDDLGTIDFAMYEYVL